MQNNPQTPPPISRYRPRFPSQPEASSPTITGAIGMGESAGRTRARRTSLFTRTMISVTSLICLAFLLGSLVQAWSNSQLSQRVQAQQQQLQVVQDRHKALLQAAQHYQDPVVIESEARQQLGYIRPGEHPVVVIASADANQQTPTSSSNTQGPSNFWQEWWNALFG